jgi:predicted trehalose synthase
MSVIDEAIARFTTFTQGVLAQLKGAKDSNDLQTGKLTELQTALDTALADDSADKATIASLQAEISSLQDQVAAQINAAVDALQNPPADVTPVVDPAPVVEPTPVVDSVVDSASVDTPPVV